MQQVVKKQLLINPMATSLTFNQQDPKDNFQYIKSITNQHPVPLGLRRSVSLED